VENRPKELHEVAEQDNSQESADWGIIWFFFLIW